MYSIFFIYYFRLLEEKISSWMQLDFSLVLCVLRICPKSELKVMFEKSPVPVSATFIIKILLNEKLNTSEYLKQVGSWNITHTYTLHLRNGTCSCIVF